MTEIHAQADATVDFLIRAADAAAHGRDLDVAIEAILAASLGPLGAGRAVASVMERDPSPDGFSHAIEVAATDDAAGPDETGIVVDAAYPLIVSSEGVERELGTLTIWWPERAFLTAPVELARATADLLAVAIDRHQLAALASERSDWLDRMAQTDALTGIANARTFARVLELEIARAQRQEGEVSVAIFDVDGLASLNEASGRTVGDDALRAVAAVVAESVRLVDTVARYGGDEFVVVAPGAAGVTVAQRVLDAVAALEPIGDRRISVSAGVARFPADATTADGLLVAAERALAVARADESGLATAEDGAEV